jgi:hypothetical protein
MFDQYSAFNTTTKKAHAAIKAKPTMGIGEFREIIAQSTPFGSTAAYKASFKNNTANDTTMSITRDIEPLQGAQTATTALTFEETMQQEFNRIAILAMTEYIFGWKDIIRVTVENYHTERHERLNAHVPNTYHLMNMRHKNMFQHELSCFSVKPTKHNMGVLHYVLPEHHLEDAKHLGSINNSWDAMLNRAFFNKLRIDLFIILECIEVDYTNQGKIKDEQAFIDMFLSLAQTHHYHFDAPYNKPEI